ncbi:hypothetical protein DFH06DRAFT_1173437, partial [Mycena polygramma]
AGAWPILFFFSFRASTWHWSTSCALDNPAAHLYRSSTDILPSLSKSKRLIVFFVDSVLPYSNSTSIITHRHIGRKTVSSSTTDLLSQCAGRIRYAHRPNPRPEG